MLGGKQMGVFFPVYLKKFNDKANKVPSCL